MKANRLKSSISALCVFFLATILAVTLSGCGAEKHNPLGVEEVNGAPPKYDGVMLNLDASGVINGLYEPGGDEYVADHYPIKYTGNWRLINSHSKQNWHTITSKEKGAQLDIVGTFSRIVVDFWDYDFYPDAGNVTFYVDGNPVGTYDLARAKADGVKLLEYQVATQKNTVATVTMKINSGRVVIAGYILVHLDERYQY
jgi:hypothetical protein